MNKKSIKGIVCSALCVAAALTAGFGVKGVVDYASADAVWSEMQLLDEYFVGTEFVLPEAKLTIGGKTVDADVSLIYPDKSATRKERVTLNQAGIYVLKYSAVVNGKPYNKEVEFFVGSDMITYTNEQTKIGYQTCLTASDPTKEYLTVSLAQNDKITFSQLIDVEDITKNETLLDYFYSPAARGLADANVFYFQFTDAENPDVYLKVRHNYYATHQGTTYFLAGGNGQELKGYEAGMNKLHVNNTYGTPFQNISMDAVTDRLNGTTNPSLNAPVNSDEWGVSFRYNAESRETFVLNATGPNLIVDQDSTKYYENLWTGFPSGKVKLTMWAEDYNGANVNFCVTAVRGIDLTAYGEKFVENDPPEITIDCEYDRMPEARVGATYPIPTATAFDYYSGNCAVDVAVWYNYGSTNATMQSIKDGKFTATQKGYYTIVYTASDRYGNQASATLSVHAGNPIDELSVEPLERVADEITLGEWISVPTEVALFGGSGERTVSIWVKNGDTKYEIQDGFRPNAAGSWTIIYTVTDYIGTEYSYDYTVSTVLPTQPTLAEKILLPNVFISDNPYVIPALYASDYRTGTEKKGLCSVEISGVVDGSGNAKTYTVQSGEAFTPRVANNGDIVTLTYKYDGYTVAAKSVPAILAFMQQDGSTRLQEQNYFYGQGFTTEKTSEGVKIVATGNDTVWTFANSLVSEGFTLVLANEVDGEDFDGFEVTLTDVQDENNAIAMQLLKSGESSVFKVVGTKGEVEIYYDFTSKTSNNVAVSFEDGAFKVNGTPLQVTNKVNGEPFEGFAVSKAYVNVSLLGGKEGSAYRVVSINDNPFTNKSRDQVSPMIAILGDYGGSYALNSEYVVNAAVASDVLAPNVNFTMTVNDPDGKPVTDKNGIVLQNVDPTVEYTIVLSSYGQYSFMYTAEEDPTFTKRTNPYTFYCGVMVIDMEAPEITFNGSFQTSVKLGEMLIIPDFKVTDNMSNANGIIVTKYVLNPTGALVKLEGETNAIITAYTGVYEFRILATDELGNTKMIRVKVTVTE